MGGRGSQGPFGLANRSRCAARIQLSLSSCCDWGIPGEPLQAPSPFLCWSNDPLPSPTCPGAASTHLFASGGVRWSSSHFHHDALPCLKGPGRSGCRWTQRAPRPPDGRESAPAPLKRALCLPSPWGPSSPPPQLLDHRAEELSWGTKENRDPLPRPGPLAASLGSPLNQLPFSQPWLALACRDGHGRGRWDK